jgi:predicted TIM-barrel fold metal-dependent hydrolase
MRLLVFVLLLLIPPSGAYSQQLTPPIIDMHLHASSLDDFGGGVPVCTNNQKIVYPGWDPKDPLVFGKLKRCESPMPAAASDEALMRESLALLERHNIYAVTSGAPDLVNEWRAASPKRIIPALAFSTSDPGPRTPDEFRQLHAAGKLAVFAENGPQYRGKTLDDASFDAFFALAEELDIPVGVHLGEGPVGGAHFLGGPTPSTYRAGLTSPFQLEEVLIRHPRLRVYVMHYASPLVDEMIAMLFSHPQVYVDIACNNWNLPREHFYSQLKRLINAGFEERIMWGSDQMAWPGTIGVAIETIEEAPFLSTKQKRDIFYNNAARFLRLSEEDVAKHHGN